MNPDRATLLIRWPWLPGEAWETTVSVHLERAGYGTLLTLTDGPFDLRVPGVLDAYAEALEGWGEALAWLRGVVDFSSDLRPRLQGPLRTKGHARTGIAELRR